MTQAQSVSPKLAFWAPTQDECWARAFRGRWARTLNGLWGSMPLIAAAAVLLNPPMAIYASPLVDAVIDRNSEAVRIMLAEGAPVDQAEADGSTALHAAALDDNLEIARQLIAAGANVNAATRYGIAPLTVAATNGSAEMIELLLNAGADPDSSSREGQTALMSAALNGRSTAVEILIERGASISVREPVRGQTALMWAAGRGNSDAVVTLVAAGADIHARSNGEFTALLLAVRENRIATAQRLLELGANIEDKTLDGTSALNIAVLNAYFDLASILLEAGANPNVADPRGSALHTAIWLHKPGATWDAIRAFSNPATAPRPTGQVTALELGHKLLEHGADPNKQAYFEETPFRKDLGQAFNPPDLMLGRHYLTYDGATPFYVAARNGDFRFMELLAEYGADATVPTKFGITALMAAAGLDYFEGETPGPFVGVPEADRLRAVQIAYELGNDINAKTDFGDYEMEGGVEYTLTTYPRNFDELANLGVGDPRFNGMMALHGAIISKQPSIVRYLIDRGADVLATNNLGWTPLMMAEGFFLANEQKVFPEAAEMLRQAMPVSADAP
jgi:ankyrin repeat protein